MSGPVRITEVVGIGLGYAGLVANCPRRVSGPNCFDSAQSDSITFSGIKIPDIWYVFILLRT